MFLDLPEPDPHVFGTPGSGSISQRYGSGSGSGDPDPHQNVTDPQHWSLAQHRDETLGSVLSETTKKDGNL
jgi:hypothetical protein